MSCFKKLTSADKPPPKSCYLNGCRSLREPSSVLSKRKVDQLSKLNAKRSKSDSNAREKENIIPNKHNIKGNLVKSLQPYNVKHKSLYRYGRNSRGDFQSVTYTCYTAVLMYTIRHHSMSYWL